jgi:SulP family sulfate permease
VKKYLFDRKTAISDLIAGITLGIESIPDGMASGVLAAVNPIHGIYIAFLKPLILSFT